MEVSTDANIEAEEEIKINDYRRYCCMREKKAEPSLALPISILKFYRPGPSGTKTEQDEGRHGGVHSQYVVCPTLIQPAMPGTKIRQCDSGQAPGGQNKYQTCPALVSVV
jgi:hypothetical protein